ncbi:T9SS type A sorting domain-containing protein [Polaribacter sp. Z022]|uniref:T9SS type A sorting domain-containing protein n=1 Tax=Polaribacter sp. Z022 TaxID=2927125 RepID=UPI00202205E0|nr:T9SS type A sorting domain-containing protein [Polaribacter sp. Z022]MCL7752542.1 T9SS type A sorting domain-containing protein [Polaribacter sp. Z022]
MKKILLFIMCPFFLFGQTQIGDKINQKLIGDKFGQSTSISIDGSIVAIGAPGNDSNGSDSGHVRIYKNESGVYTQIGDDINGEAAGDNSGFSISLSSDGSIVAIGAPGNDGNGSSSGHVRIYKNINNVWTQVGSDIDGEAAGDNSGFSISLSSDGSIVAIGAPNNSSIGSLAGHVKIYKYKSGVWTQIGNNIEGNLPLSKAGQSVSLSSDGSIVAIGAPFNSQQGSFSGYVKVYKIESGVWTQHGSSLHGIENDQFGWFINLSSDGSTIAICSNTQNYVKVYKKESNGLWIQKGETINANNIQNQGGFSISLSLSSDGNILLLGEPKNNNSKGDVNIYRFESGVWNKKGSTISGSSESDNLGFSVSLSENGNNFITSSINFNTDKSYVKIYNLNDIPSYNYYPFNQIGASLNGDKTFDNFGTRVSLSENGKTLAISAVLNGLNAFSYVRVYKNESGVWTQIGSDIKTNIEGDGVGFNLKLSANGNVLALSSINNTVRIYENISGEWVQKGKNINGDIFTHYTQDGIDLSFDGNIVVIGESSSYNIDLGSVKVYKFISDTWTQIGNSIEGKEGNDHLGYSVSISSNGNIIAISAPNLSHENIGFVRVYKNISNSWVQIGSDILGNNNWELFGNRVRLSGDGNVLALSINNYNNDLGQVKVFKNESDNWVQIGDNINGEFTNDKFGSDLSLSGNGNILAISTPLNDGNGSNSGHVRVFKNESNAWVQQKNDIDGIIDNEKSGSSISLSLDGKTLAIGAPGNNIIANLAGQVRVYDLSSIVLSNNKFQTELFKIYPNPSSKQITIQINTLDFKKASIYNSLGQFVKSSKELTIDISSLSNGIYFLQVETTLSKSSKKLVVE